MLSLYQSNRLEYLAEVFARVYRLNAPAHIWRPTPVVVQSQGMRRYLNRFFADRHGIAANMQFALPAGFVWQLMRRALPDTPSMNPFQTDVLRWRIFDLCRDGAFRQPELAPVNEALADYLGSGTLAPYHLSGKLADMFDQYLIYRSDWIAAWEAGKLVDLGADEAWQAALWRYLAAHSDEPHRAARHERLMQSLSHDVLPEQIFVFGISTLAPVYLQLFQAAAQHIDVHIFSVNPSSEYWGNVLPAESLLGHGDSDFQAAVGHPLLASLGKQGRDFFDALSEADNVRGEHSIYDEEPLSGSLLARLQHDIQTLRTPQYEAGAHMDGSIQMVGAHSRLRELEILKEQILQDLAAHPDWQPEDIVVLTPHIETYLPFIEAVFRGGHNGQPLPFSVADVKTSHRRPLMQLLAKALNLMQSRFGVDDILPLLDEPPLRQRFRLDEHDVETLTAVWRDIGVHWGTNAEMRAQYGGSSGLFTWQHARNRAVLGWLMPDNGRNSLWHGMLPWFGDIGQTALLARAQSLIDTLAAHYSLWQTAADAVSWPVRIRRLLADLADADTLAGSDAQMLESSLAQWQTQMALADFSGSLPPEIAAEHLQSLLNSTQAAGFLRGGITFCNMVPLRSLPFRCVCLLGLNDGEFPRTTTAAAFDLIAHHPRKGDRARRDDDRYLFLESILSAREKLYLSHIGKDIRKNEDCAPSALLYELTDVLADMTEELPDKTAFNARHIVQHPLQPFSRRYFDGTLRSSRSDYADAWNTPAAAPPFFAADRQPENTSAALAGNVIDTDTLIAFWRNPVQYWLTSLQWKKPFIDSTDDDGEPFDAREEDILGALYDARRQKKDFDLTATVLAQSGWLPESCLGGAVMASYVEKVRKIPAQWFDSPPRDDAAIDLDLGQWRVCGSLNRLYACGQLWFGVKKCRPTTYIELMLHHLLLCAADVPDVPHETHYLYPAETLALAAVPPDKARRLLLPWLSYFVLGQTQPLPFFPKTSLAAAQKWLHNCRSEGVPTPWGKEEHNTAVHQYEISRNGAPAQKDYPEVAQVFGRMDGSPVELPLFRQLVGEVLLPVLDAVQTDK